MTIEEKDFHIFDSSCDIDETKWITGTKFGVNILNEFNEHAQMKKWCLENCMEPVSYFEERNLDLVYFFDEADAVAFKLRWVE